MRLLNTRSLELKVFVHRWPDYVILSHRWGAEECTFDDIVGTPILDLNDATRKKQGFLKIQGACELAARDGYSWIWIDSCCIDKSSSADLQESINSMWKYYASANICYVYMADVPNCEAGRTQAFSTSTWFTRGWTLQELIAPMCVEFYAQDWAPIGTKSERLEEIAAITTIDEEALSTNQNLDLFSAAQKLSWAAHRQSLREEDKAYSLLGLFEVSMPLLYGEGGPKAFGRLLEAIYNSTADHTLFLFRYSLYHGDQPLMSDSPTRFCERKNCMSCLSLDVQCLPPELSYGDIIASERWSTQAHEQMLTTITPNRNEMSTVLPFIEYSNVSDKLIFFGGEKPPLARITHVAILNHTFHKHPKGALCLLLQQGSSGEVFRRIQSFPALLPLLGHLVHNLKTTKILICADSKTVTFENFQTVTAFSVEGELLIEEWKLQGVASSLGVSSKETSNRTAYVRSTEKSSAVLQIACLCIGADDSKLSFSIHLVTIDNVWSIKDVILTKRGVRQRKGDRLFTSSVFVDRCSLKVQGGMQLSIALRRSASDSLARQYSYRIIVKYF